MSVFQVDLTQGLGRTAQGFLDTYAPQSDSVVSTASWSANVITFTTTSAHGLVANNFVGVAGVSPDGYNGRYTVVSVPSTTQFTVRNTANPGTYVSDGVVSGASVQRGVYIMGPNKVNRLLLDGQTFTDCNYWKRFAQPTLPAESAFIKVVDDDGSPYSDFAEENLYAVAYNGASHTGFSVDATSNAVLANAVVVDIIGDTGNYAVFTQIEVTDSDVFMEINDGAIIHLANGAVQTFDRGDLPIGQLAFYNTSGVNATVSVVSSVLSKCNS